MAAGGLVRNVTVGVGAFLGFFLSGFAFLLQAIHSWNSCGYGTRGYYYNEGPHTGETAFAIDFTKYRRGMPHDNISGGIPVLACEMGHVSRRRLFIVSGNDSRGNVVEIEHDEAYVGTGSWSPEEGYTTGDLEFVESPYTSEYWHLAGPVRDPLISVGMFVRRGTRLGQINDTGISVLDHLHFSIKDERLGEQTVRPTPMDGRTLGDGDSGKCIMSSNVPFPRET